VVDELGRAYAGNFGFDLMNFGDPASTSVVRVDPDGSVSVEAEDLWFPNGMVVDGDTLIVSETFAGRLTAFSIAADGMLTEGLGAFACMLGGEDGRELLLCSAPDFLEANRKDVREAILFTTTVDVPH
jgi:sugar lactone lactonase YvrE